MNKTKSWTVLVYLAGDNDLDEFGASDLAEMKRVGSSDKINIVAQFDRATAGVNTRRFLLRRGTTLDADAVANLGETNMGDPAVLEDFIKWGLKTYPADRCMVVLWNHGNGWDDTDLYRVARNVVDRPVTRSTVAAATVPLEQFRAVGKRFRRALFAPSVAEAMRARGIAYDDNAQDFLDNIELKKVLERVAKSLKRKIDIVGMDACLMSMAEVAYQLRGAAGCTVGSEELEPGDGWPYDKILAALRKKPSMTAPQLAVEVVKRYLASYTDDNVTQSAFDLAKVEIVAKAVDELAVELTEALADAEERACIVTARTQVQTFDHGDRDYIDLLDFCDLLDGCVHAPEIKSRTAGVRKAVKNGFLLASGKRGSEVSHAKGVSIYFPTRPFNSAQALTPLYATLDFTKKTKWDEFLRAYLKATGRRG